MARRDKEKVKEENPTETKPPMSKKWEELSPIVTKEFKKELKTAKKKKKPKASKSYEF